MGSQRVRHELATKEHHQFWEVKGNKAKSQTEIKQLIYPLWLDFQIREEPYVQVFLKKDIYWWKSTDTGEIWWDSSSNW